MTTATEQSTSISSTLGQFYKEKSVSISTNGADPSFASIQAGLDYDELLRRSSEDDMGSADPTTAAAVEQVHEAVAAMREYEMSSRTRLDLYTNMASEYTTESEYYYDRATFLTSLLNATNRVPYLE
jgi:hypothetical protein